MDVADARAALGLPVHIRQPPDMGVPLVVSSEMVAEWMRQDASGSADAAYALGVRLMQAGDLAQAQEFFTRGAKRGSADGAYARFRGALALGWPRDQVTELLHEADEAGSAAAAANVRDELLARGDSEAADAAFARAVERARVRNAKGSADAAVVLATLLPDPDEQREAYVRADWRGSGFAAVQVGSAAEQDGDVEAAMSAYVRAARRGEHRAGLRLGELLDAAGRHHDAQLVWTDSRDAAVAAGNADLVAQTDLLLASSSRSWLQSHRRATLAVGVVVGAATTAILVASANGRWVVVGLVAAMFFFVYRFGKVMSPCPNEGDEGLPTTTAGDLTLSARLGPGRAEGTTGAKGREVRPLTAAGWDRLVVVVVFATYAGVLGLVCLWAAHLVSGSDLTRGVYAAAALILATFALATLGDLRDPPDPTAKNSPDTFRIGVEIGFGRIVRTGLAGSVQGPAVREYIADHQRVTPMWVRRGAVLVSVAAGLGTALLLALPALAPALAGSSSGTIDYATSLVAYWVVGGCLVKLIGLAILRPALWPINAAIYLVLAIVFGTVATISGLWALPDLHGSA